MKRKDLIDALVTKLGEQLDSQQEDFWDAENVIGFILSEAEKLGMRPPWNGKEQHYKRTADGIIKIDGNFKWDEDDVVN